MTASWTTPKTWTSGDVTASEFNTHIRDNLDYLKALATDRNVMLTSSLTTSSNSFSTATGLTFPVANGGFYNIVGLLWASNSSTSGGFAFGFDHPGGNCNMVATYTGESSDASQDHEYQNTVDTGTPGVATVNTADRRYLARLQILYQCTSSGTWSLRWRRVSAGTATLYGGSALIVNSA